MFWQQRISKTNKKTVAITRKNIISKVIVIASCGV